MTPQTFTHRAGTDVRERRRRRWSHDLAEWLAVVGVVLDQAARQVEIFPPSWTPYVRAAAFAFGAVAMLERIERRRDYNRFVRRINDDARRINDDNVRHLERLDIPPEA